MKFIIVLFHMGFDFLCEATLTLPTPPAKGSIMSSIIVVVKLENLLCRQWDV